MRKHIYIIAALALAGCSGNDEPARPDVNPEGAPMLFSASDDTGLSRSSSPLSLTNNTFRVSAYKYASNGGMSETVMSGYMVKYFDPEWDYDAAEHSDAAISGQSLKYWDIYAGNYIFNAYTPATPGDGVTINARGVTIPNAIYANTTEVATDWAVAAHRRDMSPLSDKDLYTASASPFQPAEMTSKVHLLFHHIFSKIQFRIFNTGDAPAQITDAEITLGAPIHTSGKYADNLWSFPEGSATSPTLLNISDASITVAPGTTRDESVALSGPIFEIPQRCAPTYATDNLHIALTVNGSLLEGDFTVTDNWEFDKIYVYYIAVDAGLRPILVSVEMQDFLQGETSEDIQTNW